MTKYEQALETIETLQIWDEGLGDYWQPFFGKPKEIIYIKELVERAKAKPPLVYEEEWEGGKYVTLICDECGCKIDEEDSKFCRECGQQLVEIPDSDLDDEFYNDIGRLDCGCCACCGCTCGGYENE